MSDKKPKKLSEGECGLTTLIHYHPCGIMT